MYKIGDKVEYCGEVVKITQIFDSGGCMVSNGILEAHAHLSDLDKLKSAHEKLIEMGYEHHEYSYGDVYELKESYKYNGLSGRIQTDNQGAINCGDVYIGLELSRILTQYLEELENEKEE